MQKRIRKEHRKSGQPKRTVREGVIAAGLEGARSEEPFLGETDGIILSFGWSESEPEANSTGELGDIDNEYWDLRPVNFDPETGERLSQGCAAAATAMERFDIQQDEHFCVWCGTRISRHYSPMSQWIPCVELLERNAVALKKARKQGGR